MVELEGKFVDNVYRLLHSHTTVDCKRQRWTGCITCLVDCVCRRWLRTISCGAPLLWIYGCTIYCTINCGRLWLSIHTPHILSWLTIATDGHLAGLVVVENAIDDLGSQSFEVGQGHRCTRFKLCWGRQYRSMGMLPNLLGLAMSIQGHASQCLVAGNGYRWQSLTIYWGSNIVL